MSLANFCRWLAKEAESLGVEIFPGFTASEVIIEDEQLKGIVTGEMGVSKDGEKKPSYQPSMELRGKYTILSEGCRGHLGKQIIKKFKLDNGKDPQHYGIGFKEIWDIKPDLHKEGTVMHTAGWPANGTVSGSYCYHGKNNQLYMGYVVPLDYKNPFLSPYDEFQQWKHHSGISKLLKDGTRVAYGARALIKGGYQSRPKMSFNGGLIVGDNAGTLNFPKIKGTHTAMKSGMIAAETVFEALQNNNIGSDLVIYEDNIRNSWLQKELYKARNFGPLLHKFGNFVGPILAAIDQFIFRGNLPFTLNHPTPDYACLEDASKMPKIDYPKPDGVISFDKLSSVYLSNTTHEEDQPCHLKLKDENIPISVNLPKYAEPAQRYCPAGVYEVVNENNHEKILLENNKLLTDLNLDSFRYGNKNSNGFYRSEISSHKIKEHAFGLTLKRANDEGGKASATASMFKLYGTEHNKKRHELMVAASGINGVAWDGDEFEDDDKNLTRAWLRTKGNSIEGGTSEVQLNVISKRVLGLPSQ